MIALSRWISPALAASALFGIGLVAGCSDSQHQDNTATTQPGMMDVAPEPKPHAAVVNDAIVVLHALGDSKVSGVARFTEAGGKVTVVADVEGLSPGKHGFHIHEFGDCSDLKGMSAGGHYNPEHHKHGLPGQPERHPGDMGNLDAGADGKAHLEATLEGITINGDLDPILGRSIIVHEKEDDGGQPTGNAGGRIACGVIGVAKPTPPVQP